MVSDKHAKSRPQRRIRIVRPSSPQLVSRQSWEGVGQPSAVAGLALKRPPTLTHSRNSGSRSPKLAVVSSTSDCIDISSRHSLCSRVGRMLHVEYVYAMCMFCGPALTTRHDIGSALALLSHFPTSATTSATTVSAATQRMLYHVGKRLVSINRYIVQKPLLLAPI